MEESNSLLIGDFVIGAVRAWAIVFVPLLVVIGAANLIGYLRSVGSGPEAVRSLMLIASLTLVGLGGLATMLMRSDDRVAAGRKAKRSR